MNFIEELKRRHVVKIIAVYGVAGFALLQISDLASAALRLPDWTVSFVLFILVMGLPVVAILAWVFEITPKGLHIVEGDEDPKTNGLSTKHYITFVVAGLMVVVVGYYSFPIFMQSVDQSISAQNETSVPPNSVAVLPFEDFSEARDQAYFANGIAEEILNVLARTPGLKVASRTSSFQIDAKSLTMAEIAERLNVATILEGSVRKSGNRLRITAQLINASDGFHLWSETFDREVTDIFAIQDEISGHIGRVLVTELVNDEDSSISEDARQQLIASREQVTKAINAGRTENVDAYNYYLRASYLREQRTEETVAQSIELFERAIELDPKYADAYAGLARSLVVSTNYLGGSPPEHPVWDEAKIALGRAFAINVENPSALMLYALMQRLEWKLKSAETNFQLGLDRNPNDWEGHVWYAQFLRAVGRLEDALVHINEANRLNPFNQFGCERLNILISLGKDDVVADILENERDGIENCAEVAEIALAYNTGDSEKLETLMAQLPDTGATSYYRARVRGDKDAQEKVIIEMEQAFGSEDGVDASTLAIIFDLENKLDKVERYMSEAEENQEPQLFVFASELLYPTKSKLYNIDLGENYPRILSFAPRLASAYAEAGYPLPVGQLAER